MVRRLRVNEPGERAATKTNARVVSARCSGLTELKAVPILGLVKIIAEFRALMCKRDSTNVRANFSKIGRNVGADIARRRLKAAVFSTMVHPGRRQCRSSEFDRQMLAYYIL